MANDFEYPPLIKRNPLALEEILACLLRIEEKIDAALYQRDLSQQGQTESPEPTKEP